MFYSFVFLTLLVIGYVLMKKVAPPTVEPSAAPKPRVEAPRATSPEGESASGVRRRPARKEE